MQGNTRKPKSLYFYTKKRIEDELFLNPES